MLVVGGARAATAGRSVSQLVRGKLTSEAANKMATMSSQLDEAAVLVLGRRRRSRGLVAERLRMIGYHMISSNRLSKDVGARTWLIAARRKRHVQSTVPGISSRDHADEQPVHTRYRPGTRSRS